MVGAKGFEPSTSGSRTRESNIPKSCRCRTYGPSARKTCPQLVHMVHAVRVYSACAQRPSAETSARIASVSFCSPLAKRHVPLFNDLAFYAFTLGLMI
jgi:hypothetical protein